jgi:hypothetical protein
MTNGNPLFPTRCDRDSATATPYQGEVWSESYPPLIRGFGRELSRTELEGFPQVVGWVFLR